MGPMKKERRKEGRSKEEEEEKDAPKVDIRPYIFPFLTLIQLPFLHFSTHNAKQSDPGLQISWHSSFVATTSQSCVALFVCLSVCMSHAGNQRKRERTCGRSALCVRSPLPRPCVLHLAPCLLSLATSLSHLVFFLDCLLPRLQCSSRPPSFSKR